MHSLLSVTIAITLFTPIAASAQSQQLAQAKPQQQQQAPKVAPARPYTAVAVKLPTPNAAASDSVTAWA